MIEGHLDSERNEEEMSSEHFNFISFIILIS